MQYKIAVLDVCTYIYTVPPVIDTITPSIRTVSGRSISLYCHATGEEPPRITWQYRNGTVISDSDRGASSLTLDNVHAERLDRLDIECVASNSAGFARKATRVTTVGEYYTSVGTVVLNYYHTAICIYIQSGVYCTTGNFGKRKS